MIETAITLLAIGSVGIIGSSLLEWKRKARIWEIGMKIFPWVWGTSGILLGIALTT